MARSTIRRLRRTALGPRPRVVLLGWVAGIAFTIGSFHAWLESLVPVWVVGLGGIVAGLVATVPATYRWGDGAAIGALAGTLTAVTFVAYQTVHLLYTLYVLTGDYYLLVAPVYSAMIGLGVFIAFLVSGGVAGTLVFSVKGWRVRRGSTDGAPREQRFE